ncbi:MAG: response regulator transcription factor [Bradymonadaceae bacterium]|nr:response regulator transcription factor [Lujinxingiaceae bacterium]
MRVYVVDDELPAREELAWLLRQCTDVEVVGQAASAEAAFEALDGEHRLAELVFLDVDMPGIGGMRLAELWQDLPAGRRPLVVFVTAYEAHAVEAFGVDAVDYLLKPVRLARLQAALEKARLRLEANGPLTAATFVGATTRPLARISVEDRGVYRVIAIEDILFFEAVEGIVLAQTASERLITDFSLKFLEHNLDAQRFFRSHRSFIVQLDAIESIAPWGAGTYRLILSRGRDLGVPLARSRAGDLKSLIPWSANVFDGESP